MKNNFKTYNQDKIVKKKKKRERKGGRHQTLLWWKKTHTQLKKQLEVLKMQLNLYKNRWLE